VNTKHRDLLKITVGVTIRDCLLRLHRAAVMSLRSRVQIFNYSKQNFWFTFNTSCAYVIAAKVREKVRVRVDFLKYANNNIHRAMYSHNACTSSRCHPQWCCCGEGGRELDTWEFEFRRYSRSSTLYRTLDYLWFKFTLFSIIWSYPHWS